MQLTSQPILLYRRLIGIVFLVYILFIFHLRIANQGGYGLMLPGNLIVWIFAALIVIIYWWRDPQPEDAIKLSSNSYLFLAAALLLLLPAAYTDSRYIGNALLQLLGLLAGVIFFITVRQYAMNDKERMHFFYGLLIAIGIEAVFSLLRHIFLPANLAYSGEVLQQVNVFATLVATGIGVALYCVLTPTSQPLANSKKDLLRYLLINLFLFIAVAVLVNLISLIGYITGLLLVITFFISYVRQFRRQDYMTYLVILLAIIAGIFWLVHSGGSLVTSKQQSSHERLVVWQNTWQLITEKPLLGWGYGSFEHAFQHHMIANNQFNTLPELFTHPHNEILYWWAEGGLLAIVGFLLFIIGYIRLFCRAFAFDFLNKQPKQTNALWGLALLLLPITLHNFVEYPLYISNVHWLLLISLLAILDSSVPQPAISHRSYWQPVRYISFVGAIFTLIFMATGLKTLHNITQVEQSQFQDCLTLRQTWNPWAMQQRLNYDLQTCDISSFKQTHNMQTLVSYRDWAEKYLQVHVDKTVYHNLIIIERMLGNPDRSHQLEQEAARLFYSFPGVKVTKVNGNTPVASRASASTASAAKKP